MASWSLWLGRAGAVAAVAGAALLPVGVRADLVEHETAEHALLERLPPRYARIVEAQHEREHANPWHGALVVGEGLLVGGLGVLYLSERARRLGQRRRGAPDPATLYGAAPTAA